MQACALTLDSFTRMLIHRGSRTLLNFYGSAPGTPSLRSTILALWATMQIDRSTTAAPSGGRDRPYAGGWWLGAPGCTPGIESAVQAGQLSRQGHYLCRAKA